MSDDRTVDGSEEAGEGEDTAPVAAGAPPAGRTRSRVSIGVRRPRRAAPVRRRGAPAETGADATADEDEDVSAGDPAATKAVREKPEDVPPPGPMLPKEKQYGYIVAIMDVALVLSIGTTRIGQHRIYLVWMALGLLGAAALAWATRRGQRILAAITSMVAGLALSPFGGLTNLICLAFGAYLMFKHSAAQKRYLKVHPRERRQPQSPAARANARAARRSGAKPTGPSANRRYTPPKSKTGRRR